MKYPGAVAVYAPNWELLHTLNILPAKNYAVDSNGNGVCDEPGGFDMDGWYMFKDTFSDVPAVRIYKIVLE
jgi:hypothetical protein